MTPDSDLVIVILTSIGAVVTAVAGVYSFIRSNRMREQMRYHLRTIEAERNSIQDLVDSVPNVPMRSRPSSSSLSMSPAAIIEEVRNAGLSVEEGALMLTALAANAGVSTRDLMEALNTINNPEIDRIIMEAAKEASEEAAKPKLRIIR